MRHSHFKMNVPKKTPDGGYMIPEMPVSYLCPKCGTDEVNISFMQALDKLLCGCRRCGYQGTRAPCDGVHEESS